MAMRRPGGYLFGFFPDRKPDECDSFTCRHCQQVVFVRGKERPDDVGGFCRVCTSLICPRCVNHARVGITCDVIEKKLDRSEKTNTPVYVGPITL